MPDRRGCNRLMQNYRWTKQQARIEMQMINERGCTVCHTKDSTRLSKSGKIRHSPVRNQSLAEALLQPGWWQAFPHPKRNLLYLARLRRGISSNKQCSGQGRLPVAPAPPGWPRRSRRFCVLLRYCDTTLCAGDMPTGLILIAKSDGDTKLLKMV